MKSACRSPEPVPKVKPQLKRGALVILADAKTNFEPRYLASDAPGREVWVSEPHSAKLYENLRDAQRAALSARRRPGRGQPYAAPIRAIEGFW